MDTMKPDAVLRWLIETWRARFESNDYDAPPDLTELLEQALRASGDLAWTEYMRRRDEPRKVAVAWADCYAARAALQERAESAGGWTDELKTELDRLNVQHGMQLAAARAGQEAKREETEKFLLAATCAAMNKLVPNGR